MPTKISLVYSLTVCSLENGNSKDTIELYEPAVERKKKCTKKNSSNPYQYYHHCSRSHFQNHGWYLLAFDNGWKALSRETLVLSREKPAS